MTEIKIKTYDRCLQQVQLVFMWQFITLCIDNICFMCQVEIQASKEHVHIVINLVS